MTRFELAISYWVLGKPQDLTVAAVDALEDGLDSPSLRILAGERNPQDWGIPALFAKALRELEVEMPSYGAAKMQAACYFAERIISGEMTAYDGARQIWSQLCRDDQTPEKLLVFVGLADEYEDLPGPTDDPRRVKLREEIEYEIVEHARLLINQGPRP